MRITRESSYEDAPKWQVEALRRHVVTFFANVGHAGRLAVESLPKFATMLSFFSEI